MSQKDGGQKGEKYHSVEERVPSKSEGWGDFKPQSEYHKTNQSYRTTGVVCDHIIKAIDECDCLTHISRNVIYRE